MPWERRGIIWEKVRKHFKKHWKWWVLGITSVGITVARVRTGTKGSSTASVVRWLHEGKSTKKALSEREAEEEIHRITRACSCIPRRVYVESGATSEYCMQYPLGSLYVRVSPEVSIESLRTSIMHECGHLKAYGDVDRLGKYPEIQPELDAWRRGFECARKLGMEREYLEDFEESAKKHPYHVFGYWPTEKELEAMKRLIAREAAPEEFPEQVRVPEEEREKVFLRSVIGR